MRTTSRLLAALPLLAALHLPATAQEISLDTTYASGNGQSGNMFDVRAETDIVVTRLDAHIDSGGTTVEIYTTPGTYMGKETSPGAWTMLGSVAVTGMGDVSTGGAKTPIPLTLDIPMQAGETLGFYVTTTGSSMNYTNGSSEGAIFATDGNVSITEGKGVAHPFGGNFSPRVWNGTLYYMLGGSVDQEGYKELYAIGGGANDALLGTGATPVADRNGDGITDYALGAPGENLGRGEFTIHSGATGAVLQTVAGLVNSNGMGAAIASAGDTDGNGIEDLLVGAPGDPTSEAGYAYLFRNGATFPTAIMGGTTASGYGAALAGLGDVDGDGKDDLIVGAPYHDGAGNVDGGLWELYSGGTGLLLDSAEAALSNENLGAALAAVGDLDGDGVSDVAVGAPGASEDPFVGDRLGRVTVLSGATRLPLLELFGAETDARFGSAVVGLGDVTGDGVPDLAVGAPLEAAATGAVRAYSGADGTPLWTVAGVELDGRLGACLVLLGDTNGNLSDELALGGPSTESGWGQVQLVDAATGDHATTLIHGGLATGFGTGIVPLGDVNGDPLADFVVTSPAEYKSGHPGAGVGRLVTTLGAPAVADVVGVHSLDAGEVRVFGANLVSVQAKIDGVSTPSTYVTPAELRIPVDPDAPGGFHDLELWTPEGILDLPGGLPRYPALSATENPEIADEAEVVLANGSPGIYVLAYSPLSYGYPVPFTSFGWFHGLELNGVWTLAAGAFTPTELTRSFTFPTPTGTSMIGISFYLQAFTTQTDLGYAGFTDALTITFAAPSK